MGRDGGKVNMVFRPFIREIEGEREGLTDTKRKGERRERDLGFKVMHESNRLRKGGNFSHFLPVFISSISLSRERKDKRHVFTVLFFFSF